MKKLLNYLLLVTFVLTNLVPLTGVKVHKVVSVLFLLLCIVHTAVYWKKLSGKRIALLSVVVLAFASGVLGMIFYQYPIVIALHKAISIVSVFFLAIHIFVFRKRLK